MTFFDIMTAENTQTIDQREQSIRKHLNVLLNTRQGSIAHLPKYGLPDMSEIYADLPSSLTVLMAEIKNCIEHYEPRLANVIVKANPEKSNDQVLDITIEGVVNNAEQQKFITTFASNGLANVH